MGCFYGGICRSRVFIFIEWGDCVCVSVGRNSWTFVSGDGGSEHSLSTSHKQRWGDIFFDNFVPSINHQNAELQDDLLFIVRRIPRPDTQIGSMQVTRCGREVIAEKRLIHNSSFRSIDWLIDWMMDWTIDWSIDWLIDWWRVEWDTGLAKFAHRRM